MTTSLILGLEAIKKDLKKNKSRSNQTISELKDRIGTLERMIILLCEVTVTSSVESKEQDELDSLYWDLKQKPLKGE